MTYLAAVSFPYFTLLPEDVVVNTWHFNFPVGDPAEGDFANIRERLETFYSTVYSSVGFIRFAPWIVPASNTIKMYNLEDATPRPPIYEASMALTSVTPVTTSTIPPEAAICLSYQADGLAGVPQARRRGRVFLGGLGSAIQAGSGVTFPGIANANRTAIGDAADALMNGAIADGWIWVVWSRTTSSAAAVTNGWVDDEIDTQRRRGRAPTTRYVWP